MFIRIQAIFSSEPIVLFVYDKLSLITLSNLWAPISSRSCSVTDGSSSVVTCSSYQPLSSTSSSTSSLTISTSSSSSTSSSPPSLSPPTPSSPSPVLLQASMRGQNQPGSGHWSVPCRIHFEQTRYCDYERRKQIQNGWLFAPVAVRMVVWRLLVLLTVLTWLLFTIVVPNLD